MMNHFVLCLFIGSICLQYTVLIEAKTVFHRINKISDNFKQQDGLRPEQIDPNVAPSYINSVTTNAASSSIEVVEDVTDSADYGQGGDEFIDEASQVSVTSPSMATVISTVSTTTTTTTPKPDDDNLNGLAKYCKCSDDACNCCRNFNIPFLPIKGPGCAKIRYLNEDRLSVSLKYGDITLASRTINSRRTKPICVNLPGGYSSFCGRVYGLSKAKSNFKACLGFELRADDEVEASVRVSCFKFGPDGLRVVEPEPFPLPIKNDDEDDDDYPFGFGAGTDDDDDDDDDNEDDDYDEYNEDEDENDESTAETDYGGFSLGSLFDDDDDDKDDKVEIEPVTNAITSQSDSDVAQTKDDKEPSSAALDNDSNKIDTNSSVSKKVKTKNKKQKSAADSSESEAAYDIINSLFEMFN